MITMLAYLHEIAKLVAFAAGLAACITLASMMATTTVGV
jgi:hypothetical protein